LTPSVAAPAHQLLALPAAQQAVVASHAMTNSRMQALMHATDQVTVLLLLAVVMLQTGYLPWVWGDFKSISQIDLSSNRLSG
jgi:hypothetical protein